MQDINTKSLFRSAPHLVNGRFSGRISLSHLIAVSALILSLIPAGDVWAEDMTLTKRRAGKTLLGRPLSSAITLGSSQKCVSHIYCLDSAKRKTRGGERQRSGNSRVTAMGGLGSSTLVNVDSGVEISAKGLLGFEGSRPRFRETIHGSSDAAKTTSIRRNDHAGSTADRRTILGMIQRLAPEYRLDIALVCGVVEVESNYNRYARSHKDARGLMQLMPATAERFGVANVWDPEQNLRGGMAYLRWLLDEFDGDVRLALAGYNAGEQAVRKYGGIPPYRETQAYVKRIVE